MKDVTLKIPDCISVDRERASRLSGQELNEVYKYLLQRDGERCMFCHRLSPEVKLEVHHVDGNKKRHYHSNLGLSCHKCNCRHHPKGWEKKLNVSVSVGLKDMPKPTSAEIFLKKTYLLSFLNYLEEVFIREVLISKERIICEGSVQSGFASTETIKRYLKQLTSECSPLEEWRDGRTGITYIKLKTDFKLFKDFRKKYCS
jgi:hypothetical protein